jgi:hypothetical protein|tara:strand:- start:856 stop:1026 length:171 start_codon:yes stop_codon:yes gene_type:complete
MVSKYTPEFYIALGVGVIGLLILAYFIISFFRSPRNKWSEKKRPEPKKTMSQKPMS